MARLDIRNIPDEILLSLSVLAKEEHQSRESFLREQLTSLVNGKNFKTELEKIEAEFFQPTLFVLEENNRLLREFITIFKEPP
ncbi:hypothetical protein [Lactovum odontotermitis]